MNERRIARLQEQIKQRLAEVLQREIADPKLGLVTITRVELDREFTQCKAYWSVIATKGKEEWAKNQSAGVLERARGFCQREMAKVLHKLECEPGAEAVLVAPVWPTAPWWPVLMSLVDESLYLPVNPGTVLPGTHCRGVAEPLRNRFWHVRVWHVPTRK